MVSIIFVVLFLLFPLSAQATTYYVATTGNNGNPGTDESTPFLTVAHCVSTMNPGDTCYVKDGTYNEGVIRFGRSGTQDNPIKLLNYPGHAPVIDFVTPGSPTFDRITILNFSGQNVGIGWITIEGFELTGGYEGIKWYSLHDSTIRRNLIHHNANQGMLGIGGTRVLIEQNIIHHNGGYDTCVDGSGTATGCNQDHGIYAHGSAYTIRNNIIYANQAFGIQQNGSSSSSYDPAKHPSTEFAGAANWIIESNTFAYEYWRGGITVWGGNCDGTRIENNIFYENSANRSASPQGIEWVGAGGSTRVTVKNNHFYASGSGGTVGIGTGAPADLVSSGNVTNVSPPAFVNGGSNSLPASPDFRLTASAPVNICLPNEFPNNSTCVVGVYKTTANPTASITANVITLNFPMSTAVPVQNLSTAGVTVGCTGSACPGSPAVGSVAKRTGTDSQIDITVTGISGNACESANQTWTVNYNSSTGSWSGNDNIGPYPGSHQKVFTFTNLPVTNQCTGSGPPPGPTTPILEYIFDDGTGTTVTNTGSLGASGNGTLANGATWANGGGMEITTQQSAQHLDMPYGSGFNPTTDDLTVAFTVIVPSGQEALTRTYFGPSLGTNQRLYIGTFGGTWGLGVQASATTAVSDIAVDVGSQHVCMTVNSATDTVTLHKNGAAATSPNAVKTATGSYVAASDFDLGWFDGSVNGSMGIFRNFVLYDSVEDCDAIYQATQATPPTGTGTFSQAAIQFQAPYLTGVGDSPTNFGALNSAKTVVKGGGVAMVAQIHCTNVADCEDTAFRWAYRKDGTGSWQQIPNTETADGIFMWGASSNQFLNNGATTTRLTGSCAVTNGVTLLTAAQIPTVDLPQDGCVMLRVLMRIAATASGYYEIRLEKEGGVPFAGTYVLGRIDVIPPQASAGF